MPEYKKKQKLVKEMLQQNRMAVGSHGRTYILHYEWLCTQRTTQFWRGKR